MISRPALKHDYAAKPSVPWSYDVERRVEVRPVWPFRLRGRSMDGLFVRRGQSLQRLLHIGDTPAHVGVVVLAPERVLFAARSATEETAEQAISQMRFALSVDEDLREFHELFRDDPLIGKAVRSYPGMRLSRNPNPWEAFAWAVTEQLIEVQEAVAIQRRMVWKIGRHCPATGLRDAPSAATIAGAAPALIESCGLSHGRTIALRRAAREVVAGRVDLDALEHEIGWRRLRMIPGIGQWTIDKLAVHGQGRYDQVPAGDLGYLKVVGRITTANPKARVEESVVRELLEPYGKWQGLAGNYLLYGAHRGLLPSLPIPPHVSDASR